MQARICDATVSYHGLAAGYGPPRALAPEILARGLFSSGHDKGIRTEANCLRVLAWRTTRTLFCLALNGVTTGYDRLHGIPLATEDR